MAEWYSELAPVYHNVGWHEPAANKLVEGVEIKEGDKILDIATGTGLAGIAALERAGESGHLVGVDISLEMLKLALQAFEERGFRNVELVLADAQKMDLTENSFDVVICASALVFFPDLPWTVAYWKKFLIPGGRIAVHSFSENSHVAVKLIQKAAAEFGFKTTFAEPTGTIQKCQKLFEDAGFTSVVVTEDVGGRYVSMEHIEDSWDWMCCHPMIQLTSLVESESQLDSIREVYIRFAKELLEEKGIWDNNTMFYIYGQKPVE